MNLYTIGFTQKTAEEFFGLISEHKIKLLIDIRLNNNSQLAGFTKGENLGYFLKKLCKCNYEYCPEYAPSSEILSAYRKNLITWEIYEIEYKKLMRERDAFIDFWLRFGNYKNICLLCSEDKPDKCHRRLFAEMIDNYHEGVNVVHI